MAFEFQHYFQCQMIVSNLGVFFFTVLQSNSKDPNDCRGT